MGEERQEQTDLFNGTKFWLSRGVPHRTALIQQLKENGGVLLEHTPGADILIVDPARPDNPVNSFSYKYIEKSIEKGKVANLEDYRAGRAPGTSRPVGSSTLAKKTRIPYTLAEDRELREYVLQCEKEGKPTSGRVIYEEYEKTHPQHTWQSWRDRWVKILATKYGPLTEPDMPLELESSSSTATKVKKKKDEQKGGQAVKESPDDLNTARPENEQPRKHPRSEEPETPPPGQRSAKRARNASTLNNGIIPEETEELLKRAEHLTTLNAIEEDEFYEEFAGSRLHSASEYRSHFYDTVMPEYHKREIAKRKPAPKPSKPAVPQSKTQRPRDKTETATKTRHRSSSVSSLHFDVLERDVPHQSAENSNDADADAQNDGGNEHHNDDDDDDERSLRLVSQEPVSSWEQSQTTQLPGNPAQNASDDDGGDDDDDMELEQQVPQGLGQEDDDDDDNESESSGADGQSAKPREPSIELGGSGTATREKTPLPYTPSSQPSLPSQSSQQQPANPSVNEEEETRKIETWITSKCKEYDLTDPAPVIEALLCTSVSLEHADQVVGYLVKGKGVPKNIRGVWTRNDDGDLQSGDQVAIERTVKKHGPKLVGLREEYLSKRAQLDSHEQEMVNGL